MMKRRSFLASVCAVFTFRFGLWRRPLPANLTIKRRSVGHWRNCTQTIPVPLIINGTEIIPGLTGSEARFNVSSEDFDRVEYDKHFPNRPGFSGPKESDSILQALRTVCGPWYRRVRISDADYKNLEEELD